MSCTPECASSTRRCRRRVIRSELGVLKVLEGVKSHQILHKVVTFLRSESPRLQEVLCIIRERRKTMPRHHTPPQKPRTPPELELKSGLSVTPVCVVCGLYFLLSFIICTTFPSHFCRIKRILVTSAANRSIGSTTGYHNHREGLY